MPDDERDISNDAPFANSVARIADTENVGYLGDEQILDSLLRSAFNAVSEVVQRDAPLKDRMKVLHAQCRRVASALLGRSRNYSPVDGWNQTGSIDEFLAKWTGSNETDPMKRIEHFVLNMINELLELADYSTQPGVLEEQWKWQVAAIFQKHVSLAMGITPPAQALS